MSEDITFCFSECDIKRCIRNKKNIKHPEIFHSFAFLEMTEDCLKSSIKNEGEMILQRIHITTTICNILNL